MENPQTQLNTGKSNEGRQKLAMKKIIEEK